MDIKTQSAMWIQESARVDKMLNVISESKNAMDAAFEDFWKGALDDAVADIGHGSFMVEIEGILLQFPIMPLVDGLLMELEGDLADEKEMALRRIESLLPAFKKAVVGMERISREAKGENEAQAIVAGAIRHLAGGA